MLSKANIRFVVIRSCLLYTSGGEGAFIALPELAADGLAQNTGGDDPAGIFIELLEQLQLLCC